MQKPLSLALVTAVTALALVVTAVPASAGASSEKFDHVTALVDAGWTVQNNSEPVGTTDVFQGNPKVFTSHDGIAKAYAAMNYHATDGVGTISDWLITPMRETLSNGDTWSVYTRGQTGSWSDRLEIRMSTNGSCDPGTSATDVGDFTTVLTTINEDLTVGGYPSSWTEYAGTLSGLDGDQSGCLAFRYYVTDGGPDGANSNFIGLDTYTFTDDAAADCTSQQKAVKGAQAKLAQAKKALASAEKGLRHAQHSGSASAIAKATRKVTAAKLKVRTAQQHLAQATKDLKACQVG